MEFLLGPAEELIQDNFHSGRVCFTERDFNSGRVCSDERNFRRICSDERNFRRICSDERNSNFQATSTIRTNIASEQIFEPYTYDKVP